MRLFRRGIVGAGQWQFIANVTTPDEVLFCEKDGTRAKKPRFCVFFGVFLGFEHSCSVEPGKLREKCCKKQLQGSRKLVQGTRGSILTFGCDKSADLVSENCKKVEIWP